MVAQVTSFGRAGRENLTIHALDLGEKLLL
jgi:hypothetical protein